MNNTVKKQWRVLAIDDNTSIHDDYNKVLISKETDQSLLKSESLLFGDAESERSVSDQFQYQIDSAFQGAEGLELVRESIRQQRPYSVALVDVRMPPGWDGVETVQKIWEVQPDLPIVLCTAYADYKWEQLHAKLPRTDQLLILKKPFESARKSQSTFARRNH